VRDAEFFVAVEVRAGDRRHHQEGVVTLASAVDRRWLDECFPDEIELQRSVEFDGAGERAIAVDRERFRGLVLNERRTPTSGGAGSELLLEWALGDPERALKLAPRDEMLLRRIDFSGRHGAGVVDGVAADLLRRAVAAACAGADSAAQLRRVDTGALLSGLLSFDQRRRLELAAPESYVLPSGRVAPIAYDRAGVPAVSARIQELFGLRDGPRIAGGAVAVALEILGPNHRPVQVTTDLASFWATTYPDVRRQLRGRYPKHDWPEDPWNAVATSRVGKRRRS
jgi:ATP-dependent helicase HrpB